MKNDDVILARLDALEVRVAELEADKALSKRPPQPRPLRIEEGVRISYPAPVSSFVMPSISELQQLLAIVYHRYPRLAPEFHEELAFFEGFSRAFLYVGNIGRADEPNGKVSVLWWLDHCRDWLKRSNVQGDVLGACFMAACLAQGVDYIADDPGQGTVWTFALKAYGGRPEKGDGWRAVLATGKIKPPVATNSSRPRPDVRIVAAGE
jgi:hypothetical protein